MSASLIHGDACAIPLADDSVDLIVTSSPYFALRSYTDNDGEHYDGQIGSEPTPAAFLEALWAVTAECRRVLKPSGSMFVNLGDKYAGSGGHNNTDIGGEGRGPSSYNKAACAPPKSLMGLPWRYAIGCIDELGLILRAEIVWSKPNGLPESVTDRVRRSHEQWFHFTKEPRYYAAVDEIREEHIDAKFEDRKPSFQKRNTDRNDWDRHMSGGYTANPLGKLPGSVWSIPSEPLRVPDHIGVDHFAAFPQEWPRRLILGWSPPGICVDCGEGRRPVVAKEKTPTRPCGVDQIGTRMVANGPGGEVRTNVGCISTEATITGYACACPTTDAPTHPAVVLDPFAGTGTTVMVARALGRYGVGLDLSADYLRLAEWRVFRSGHAAKAIQRTHRDNQGQLL